MPRTPLSPGSTMTALEALASHQGSHRWRTAQRSIVALLALVGVGWWAVTTLLARLPPLTVRCAARAGPRTQVPLLSAKLFRPCMLSPLPPATFRPSLLPTAATRPWYLLPTHLRLFALTCRSLSLYFAVSVNLALQEDELAVLRHFPPRTLPDLVAQRDVLLSYAAASPATVLAGYCTAYVLMQVGAAVLRFFELKSLTTAACMVG